MMFVSLSPFVVLIGVALWRHARRHRPPGALLASVADADIGGAISVAMWNYMGWDNASTIAQEVDDPQRNYPRAMLGAAAHRHARLHRFRSLAVWARRHPRRPLLHRRLDRRRQAPRRRRPRASPSSLGGMLDGLGIFNALTLTLHPPPLRPRRRRPPARILTRLNAAESPGSASSPAPRLGARARPHLRAPHLHRPRPLRRRAPARVRRPHRPPPPRARLPRPFRVPGGLAGAIATGVGPTLLIAFALWAAARRNASSASTPCSSPPPSAAPEPLVYAATTLFQPPIKNPHLRKQCGSLKPGLAYAFSLAFSSKNACCARTIVSRANAASRHPRTSTRLPSRSL